MSYPEIAGIFPVISFWSMQDDSQAKRHESSESEQRQDAPLALGQYFRVTFAIFLRLEAAESVDASSIFPYAGDKGRTFLEKPT